jgi:hypothetical protein
MAEDSNGRCEISGNFYLKKKDKSAAPSCDCGNTPQHTATHCNVPLLLGHLLLIFTSQINTLLGKTGFVWIFVNV